MVASMLVAVLVAACSRPRGSTVEDKRAQVRRMRDDLLKRFHTADPSLRGKIRSAAGYGAFSNTGMKAFVIGSGHGYGLVHDNRTGEETFMRMAQLGGGIGFGLKNFLALFVFHDRKALDQFVEFGWQIGGETEATAVAGDVGASAGMQVKASSAGAAAGGTGQAGQVVGRSIGSGIEVYRLTQLGATLDATVSGTKYWKDSNLN